MILLILFPIGIIVHVIQGLSLSTASLVYFLLTPKKNYEIWDENKKRGYSPFFWPKRCVLKDSKWPLFDDFPNQFFFVETISYKVNQSFLNVILIRTKFQEPNAKYHNSKLLYELKRKSRLISIISFIYFFGFVNSTIQLNSKSEQEQSRIFNVSLVL